jgi:hypothetical protein
MSGRYALAYAYCLSGLSWLLREGLDDMKRWVLWGVMVILLLSAVVVGVAWWRPFQLFRAAAVISPDFAAKWAVNREMIRRKIVAELGKSQNVENLETQVIRIEMEGRRYDVPIRYAYWEAFQKRGYWPRAKPDRVSVGALSLSVLLPDMKPYYPEDDIRWKILGRGDRLEVTIAVKKIDWFRTNRDNYFDGQDQISIHQGEILSLAHFVRQGQLDDVYFPVDVGLELKMYCSKELQREGFSPSCRVTSNYRPGVVLSYSYSKNYFPDWREIDSKLKALFDQFEQAASTHEEK